MTAGKSGSVSPPAVHSAVLGCEVCGAETPHRILRLDHGSRPDDLRGVARCQNCRTTHRFASRPPAATTVRLILSTGRESRTEAIELPPSELLRVGELLPGRAPAVEVRRLDLADGGTTRSAAADRVVAIWGALRADRVLRISEVVGRTTIPHQITIPDATPIEVGGTLRVDGHELHVWALRARARTWQRPGDRFPAGEVDRVYARRYRMPPAGSNDWTSPREMPSSRATSTSAAGRSRSSPGVRIRRTRPRAASAGTGATTHGSSDS